MAIILFLEFQKTQERLKYYLKVLQALSIFLEKVYKCPDTYRISLYHKNIFLNNSIL